MYKMCTQKGGGLSDPSDTPLPTPLQSLALILETELKIWS